MTSGKSGGDDIDDPELKMLNDEHQNQLQRTRAQLAEETRKAERAQAASQEKDGEIERMKAQMQAEREKFARDKAEVRSTTLVDPKFTSCKNFAA